MAYQTGTATDPIDLLQKLVTFLNSNGWTQDASSNVDGAGTWRVHMHRGSVYVNLKATIGAIFPWAMSPTQAAGASDAGIHLYLGTGYAPGSNWNAQAGGPIGSGQTYTVGATMPLATGAITAYHFFADSTGDNIVVVVEKTAGIFTHLGWGTSPVKAGSFTGGPYFFSTAESTWFANSSTTAPGYRLGPSAYAPFQNGAAGGMCAFILADVDTFTGKWIGVGTNPSNAQFGYTGKLGSTEYAGNNGSLQNTVNADLPNLNWFIERCTPVLTAQAHLVPRRVYVARDAGGSSLLGTIPGIFLINATQNGFTPGTVISLGPDNYILFHNFAVKKV